MSQKYEQQNLTSKNGKWNLISYVCQYFPNGIPKEFHQISKWLAKLWLIRFINESNEQNKSSMLNVWIAW